MQPCLSPLASISVSFLAMLSVLHAAADGQELPAAAGDPTVIGQVEHTGFALIGSRGKHYVFGGLAIADYSDSAGTRRIVTLQREDEVSGEQHDYYRELRTGHRWAVSRKRGSDGQFAVWFQLAPVGAAKPKWLPFHRARLEMPKDRAVPVPTMLMDDNVALVPCQP